MVAEVSVGHAVDAPLDRNPTLEILEAVKPLLEWVLPGGGDIVPDLHRIYFSL